MDKSEEQSVSTISLTKIIHKLGHNLHEVRDRSFQNILSKLHSGIITLEDLLHEHLLYVHLMEFLNRNENILEVINLFIELSKFPHGAENLIKLGGIEFFTQFRHDEQHKGKQYLMTVENLLDNLFHLHTDISSGNNHYEFNDQYSKNISKKEKEKGISSEKKSSKEDQSEIFSTSSSQQSYHSHFVADSFLSSNKKLSEVKLEKINKSFEVTSTTTFQFIPLSSGDRQILHATDNRLKSASSAIIKQSCDFFQGVILHDFPAEVFLQRPSIFRTFISLLTVYKSRDIDITLNILLCLIRLSENLRSRMLHNSNGDLWQKEYNFVSGQSISVSTNQSGSTDTVESTIEQLDLHENHETKENFETSIITEALMQEQVSVTDFALSLLLVITDLLKQHIEHNEMFITISKLFRTLSDLLVLDDFIAVWKLDDLHSKKRVYDFITCLHKFEGFLEINSHNDANMSKSHQVKMLVIIKLMLCFIASSVSDEKVYEVMTDKLVILCQSALTKVTYLGALPFLQKSLLHTLSCSDQNFNKNYTMALKLLESMKSIDVFQKILQEKVYNENIFEVAFKVLPGLFLHAKKNFVEEAVNLCSSFYLNKNSKKQSIKLFNDLINYNNETVREIVYAASLAVIKKSLSISLVCEPLSTSYQSAMFLIRKNVLSKIVCEDIHHANHKISAFATSILHTILSSPLCMSVKMRKRVLEILSDSLVYLQAKLNTADKAVSNSILLLFNQQKEMLNVMGEKTSLLLIDRVKGVLRMMLLNSVKMRRKGFSWMTIYLNDFVKEYSIQKNISINFSPENFFMFENQDFVVNRDQYKSITSDDVLKLWEIFAVESVADEIKYSAAEQLAIMLEDHSLQESITTKSAYMFVVDEIQKHLYKRSEHQVPEKHILSLVHILRNFIEANETTRHILSSQINIFFYLFQLAILFHKNESLRNEIACVLVYLLFEDILLPSKQLEKTMLSECIAKNYKLPIKFHILLNNNHDEKKWLEGEEYLFFLKVSCLHFCDWYKNDDNFNDVFKLNAKEKESQYSLSFDMFIEEVFEPLFEGFDRGSFFENLDKLKLLLQILEKSYLKKDPQCDHQINVEDEFEPKEKVVRSHNANDNLYAPYADTVIQKIRSKFSKLFEDTQMHRTFISSPFAPADYPFFLSILSLFKVAAELGLLNLFQNYNTFLLCCNTSDIVSGKINIGDVTHQKKVVQQIIVTIFKIFSYNSHGCDFQFKLITKPCMPQFDSVGNLVVAVYKNLLISGSESYYDLPLMESVLALLVHLLAYQNWSLEVVNGDSMCLELFHWLVNIVTSFQVDRVDALVSFMGKGIVKSSVICLCHLVHEIKILDVFSSLIDSYTSKNIENSCSTALPWLSSLVSDRSTEIRWGGWILATAFLSENDKMIVTEFQNQPGGIWAAAIGVILNHKEAFVVRAQSCVLLCRLFKQLSIVCTDNFLWESMVVQDTITKKKATGSAAFLLLFEHFDLYNEIRKMFDDDFSHVLSVRHVNASTSMTQDSYISENILPTNASETMQTLGSKYSDIPEDVSLLSSKYLPNEFIESNHTKLLNEFIESNHTKLLNESSELSLHILHRDFLPKQYKSLLMKRSVIDVVSGLILLSPEDVLSKMVAENVLDAIFRNWNPTDFVTLSKSYPPQIKLAKKLVHHSKVALAVANLVNVLISSSSIKKYENVCIKLVIDFKLIEKFYSLFSLSFNPIWEYRDIYMDVWHNICSLLGGLVVNFKETIPSLAACLTDNVQSLCGALSFVITVYSKLKTSNKCTDSLLKLLVIIFQMNEFCLSLLDVKPVAREIVKFIIGIQVFNLPSENICVGEYLCCILLYLHNRVLCNSFHLGKMALSSLFNVSEKAKQLALKEGFAEIFIEEMKDLLIKTNICSIREGKKVDENKAELFQQLIDCLNIVRNFAVHAENIKCALISGGITIHLLNVRVWSAFHPPLVDALLLLLLVLSCHCRTAQVAICSQTSLVNKHALDETSFIQYNIKMLEKLQRDALLANGKLSNRTAICFGILINAISFSECRKILFKSGLLGLFTTIYNTSSSGNMHQRKVANALLSDWLKLLSSLSFFQDGAKVIWKIPDILLILISMINGSSLKKQDYGLLILRNIAYVPAIKQSLSSNSELLSSVLEKLTSQSLKTKSIISGFFWILTYGNQKAMNFLKKSNFKNCLMALKDDVNSECISPAVSHL